MKKLKQATQACPRLDFLPAFNTTAKAQWRSALWIFIGAMLCWPWLNVELAHTQPWDELGRMGAGLMAPNFAIDGIVVALANTLAFALQACTAAALLGFLLAPCYRFPAVAAFLTLLRSIHELFWALLILQVFGLSTLTGLLALAIPYSATFARVYAEIFEEVSPAPSQALPYPSSNHSFNASFNNRKRQNLSIGAVKLSHFLYTTLPQAWPHLLTYFSYRLECALRASVVLGFVGLPTLGFLVQGYLKAGSYAEVMALLMLVIILVLTLRWWLKFWLFWPLLLASIFYLPPLAAENLQTGLFMQLLKDFVPAPWRYISSVDTFFSDESLRNLWHWLSFLWRQQIAPGLGYTLVLSQLALLLSMVLALFSFPFLSRSFITHAYLRAPGAFLAVILRSLPEILMAFLGLIFFGPSLLPGVLAIGLHNGAILANLMGRYSDNLCFRADIECQSLSGSLNHYIYEFLPRVYSQFLAFLLYRWEVILRETAILGMIGIPTLGFYIDSAFESFRFDRALILILVSAGLNVIAEYLARKLRSYAGQKHDRHAPVNADAHAI